MIVLRNSTVPSAVSVNKPEPFVVAVFAVIVLFVTTTDLPLLPYAKRPPPYFALFSAMSVFAIVAEPAPAT